MILKRVQTLSFLLLLAAGLTLSACEQGEGQPCQVATDCSSGLVCCLGAAATHGICGNVDDDRCGESEPPPPDASGPSEDEDGGE
jgi:hypothetical protein